MCLYVGHRIEDGPPVSSDLLPADELTVRMSRLFAPVVGVKASNEGVKVMGIEGRDQSVVALNGRKLVICQLLYKYPFPPK